MKRNILIVSDFDSRIKWGCSLAYLIGKDDAVTVVVKDNISKHIEYYFEKSYNIIKYSNLIKLLTELSFEAFDILIIALGGHANTKIINFIKQKYIFKRPVIISGFNGLVDPTDPHGLLCRYGSDLICVNSRKDLKIFSQILEEMDLDSSVLVNTGIIRKYLKHEDTYEFDQNRSKAILFVEQAGLPPTKKQAIYLLEKLSAYARDYNSIPFYILCRKTSHREHINRKKRKFCLRKIWQTTIKETPCNVIFTDDIIENILPKVNLCISFTSTAVIEALILKKKVAIIKDFGIRKDIGNHVFIGSNLFSGLDELIAGKIPKASENWISENCGISNDVVELNQKIDHLLEMKYEENLPNIDIFYSDRDFSYFYTKRSSLLLKIHSALKSLGGKCE